MYFSGIGGVGIGPLAQIAADAGYDVLGSDVQDSLITEQLRQAQVEISNDQTGDWLETQHAQAPIDWYVYSSALPDDHPELQRARSLGIATTKRDGLLAKILAEKNLRMIAIAGTHGKTSTTSLMVWLLRALDVPISYSVGTTLDWAPSGHYDPDSQYFIYECDEYDRNFLTFAPKLSLITSIDYDHPDIYPTKADYVSAFLQFADQSQAVIAWDDQRQNLPDKTLFLTEVVDNLPIRGEHNRRNASLILAALDELGIEKTDIIRTAIGSFPGANRRFEKLAHNLYSDYGHTPNEVAATLQMAHEMSDNVALVYQPHQNIRQYEVREQYTDAVFNHAGRVYWLPTYLSREDERPVLTPEDLTSSLHRTDITIAEPDDALWQTISDLRRDGYLVLCMGAGSIDGWLRQQLDSE